ncbi:MAG: hypothetical protein K2P99_01780 [Burkholderiales bacterium]|nr:hypothetical protein [Burkholderiales bacterium]
MNNIRVITIMLSCLLIVSCATQSEKIVEPPIKYPKTNTPIMFNSKIDDINIVDPRIQSIVKYPKISQLKVKIKFYNIADERFANKLNEIIIQSTKASASVIYEQNHNSNNNQLVKVFIGGN